jgi:hypothetical protein
MYVAKIWGIPAVTRSAYFQSTSNQKGIGMKIEIMGQHRISTPKAFYLMCLKANPGTT